MTTQTENAKKIEESLNLVRNKDSKIYFLTQDTQGRPAASLVYIYELVKLLREQGYNAIILHEKDDYKLKSNEEGMGIEEWLGSEYAQLPHASVESGGLSVGPSDFLIVPELFAHVMEQTKEMTCTKIVLCQAYDYIFEMLQPGMNWAHYGYHKAITTSEASKEYINSVFPNIEVSIIPVTISDNFYINEKPKQPLIAIHTREPRDTMKIVKAFYVRFPQFKWVTFRDMRGMTLEQFAQALEDACGAVWIDDISGFGTFPLECMKAGVPVIGKIPNLKPNWLKEENGFWTFEQNQMVDIINAFVKTWLEDGVPEKLFDEMKETVSTYTVTAQHEALTNVFGELFEKLTLELEGALNKFTIKEEN